MITRGTEVHPGSRDELLRGLFVPGVLDQDIQPVTVLIDHPPHIGRLALHGAPCFLELPFLTGSRTEATERIRRGLAELAAPFANGLRGYNHAAFTQELFSIAEAQEHRTYHHTAWLMITTGNRRFLYVVVAGAPSMPHLCHAIEVPDKLAMLRAAPGPVWLYNVSPHLGSCCRSKPGPLPPAASARRLSVPSASGVPCHLQVLQRTVDQAG
jgi:hypothetical protein